MEIQANSIDDFIAIVKRKINIGVRHAAIQVGNQINQIYSTAIDNFYSDYSPVLYQRTRSLKAATFGVGGRSTYYKQLAQMEYEAGINVGSEYIPGEPYEKDPPHGWNLSKWIIFDRAYNEGIHGFSAYDLKLYNKNRKKNEGRLYYKTVPPKSSPPAKEVQREYKKLKKEGERILRQEINSAFGGQVC